MTRNDNDSSQEKYSEFLKDIKEQSIKHIDISQKNIAKTVHIAKYKAKISNIMITLAIVLLLIPITTIFSYLYYGINNKANDLIKVSSQLIYVTEPNIALSEDINTTIKFFNMDEELNTVRRVGKKNINNESIHIRYVLDRALSLKRDARSSVPLTEMRTNHFIFPNKPFRFDVQKEWNQLDELPKGSVAEVYVSFNTFYSPEDVRSKFTNEIDVRWLAVRSGREDLSFNEHSIPLGYPLQGDSNMYSPFHTTYIDEYGLEQTFLNTVHDLAEQQKIVSSYPCYQNISFVDQENYLKSHGIKAYGVVVTGPVNELKKLQNDKSVRAIKIGEVALWNWES